MTSREHVSVASNRDGRARRCKILFLEPRSRYSLDLPNIVESGSGLRPSTDWWAYAGHLDGPIPIDEGCVSILRDVSDELFEDLNILVERFGEKRIDQLLSANLLIVEGITPLATIERDNAIRVIPWWPMAALALMSSRWTGVDLAQDRRIGQSLTLAELVANFGQPPRHGHYRKAIGDRIGLEESKDNNFDHLLKSRSTCRRFDPNAVLSLELFSQIIGRVWRTMEVRTTTEDVVLVKKTSPSGGSLHATEVYFLVQRLEGIEPGWYHYLPTEHALERLAGLSSRKALRHSYEVLAGQKSFSTAPVLAVMTARFDRLFWKYRNHQKALRVAFLDVGHLSQTLYLSATERSIGAFVSAAINETFVEQQLELNPLREGVLVAVGFGPVSAEDEAG